ncbi:MAG: hybrid sensor histidine kinase/response regulator [Verrucomicrobia bacterium]|nr:MAG: hybrid sensor histidine kinase/response regulator [Verrucomicrobiota bacterium]
MDKPLQRIRLLIVEDNPSDADLMLRELRRAGFDPDWRRVETEPDFLASLEPEPDLILSDYAMPQFSGLKALQLVGERGLKIPFILVSATIGEETAVAAMREGAVDYLLKDRLARLGPAVAQALEQSKLRQGRERAEEASRASEQRFALFMDNLPGFAWIKDEKRRYVYANRTLRQLVLRARDWFGKTDDEIWSAELAANYKATDLQVIETKAPKEIVETVLQGEEQRTALISKFPILNDQGEVAFICGIGIDITEQKQAEERMREQADIINRAQDAIIVRDFESNRITFWNTGAQRLYGWTADEALGRSIGELIFADPSEVELLSKALVSTGEFHGEIRQVTKDKKELIVSSRATLVRRDDGSPRSVLIVNTDITEHKKLETQLLRAQRLESIGTLASGVAHDLNNVLSPILMGSEILRRTIDDEEAGSILSLIDKSARRGSAIVKQVLTFARGIEGERVLIKPSHLIQEMCDIAQRTFPKSIEVRCQYSEDIWSVQGDPTQLHQVLLNLAVNSRDAMPNGGLLTIAAENFQVDEHYASMTPGARPGPHVLFRVSDTGEGMPRAVLDKIFDPFFTTKGIGKGTGLGLSTSLGIVKSHAGFISVYSELRSGTTFKIFVPAQLSEETSVRSDLSFESLKGNGQLILVVDDEPNVLSLTRIVLEKHNYRVLTANDAPGALAVFAQQMASVNVLLTDIMMPYMDGIALIRAVQQMKPGLTFIASTGQGDETRTAELQSLRVTNVLTKPYDTQKLLECLHDALNPETHEP